MKELDKLKKEYSDICKKENVLRDKRCEIREKIDGLEQLALVKEIKKIEFPNQKIKYYVGGHPCGLDARVNFGILLSLTDDHAIIKTQTGKLYKTELFAEEATPRFRIAFLDQGMSALYDRGNLKDGQEV